jgi:integrase
VGGVSGLLLHVAPTGSRAWVLRVRVGGKRRDVGLGGFPDVTLEHARTKAREKRAMIEKGLDPVAERRAARDALRAEAARSITFDDAALLCHAARSSEFKNEKFKKDWLSAITRFASPKIGNVPVGSVGVAEVMQVLEPIWQSRTETASRLRGRIEAVLDWATVAGYRSGENPARWKGHLQHMLARPTRLRRVVKHFKAVPWQEMPTFMAELRKRKSISARCLEFKILTASRSLEVRRATWGEIDLRAKLWTVPAERMKSGKQHRVPLSRAVLALLRKLPKFVGSQHVFPSANGGALSDMALLQVMRKLGRTETPHGTARSSFKDWAREAMGTKFTDEASELALAHVATDATRAAYARGELLEERRRLMTAWGEFCASTPHRRRR